MPTKSAWKLTALATLLATAGCGGGGSGPAAATTSTAPPTATTPPPTTADASRLLDQATFGVTAADLAHVQSVGINAYVAEQLAAAPSVYTGFTYTPHTAPTTCVYDSTNPTGAASLCARDSYSLFQVQRQFFIHALTAPDQLRQRVAFALSQIFVTSGVEIYEAYGMADYQNMLLNDAFGNFRALLQDVTLSPVMGHYLDMVNNDKANAAAGTSPNENYGREVLQLLSIGLYQLNADGSQMLDGTGNPIPTYTQDVVEGFSAVFTSWTYPPLPTAATKWTNPINFDGVMVSFSDHHETGTKLLLNGVTVPAGQTPDADLAMALDNIFNHPNVGPFIGKQLIQHLVTSNPSPAYVARVSAVFADNGQKVRGDLSAVVTAILTDPEARAAPPSAGTEGHLREPALFIAGLMRSLSGTSDGVLLRAASSNMGQPIYTPQSVFSFYPPSYLLPGTATLAPEFGIDDAATTLARANFVNTLIFGGGAKPDPTVQGSTGTTIDLTSEAAFSDPSSLIAQLNAALMHGTLSDAATAAILTAVNAQAAGDQLAAARTAVYLILTSGQYQVEH